MPKRKKYFLRIDDGIIYIVYGMVDKLHKLLAKIGLNEQERSLVLRATIASTAACAVLAALFFGLYLLGEAQKKKVGDAPPPIDRDAYISAPGVGDLDIEAHAFTARRQILAGRPDAAIPHLRRIAALRRDDPAGIDALDKLVGAYLELGEFDKALETATSLLYLIENGDMATSLQIRRGMALYYMKEYEESARLLQEVLDREPDNVEALTFKGQMEAAAAEGPSPTAERFFRRAMELDPNNLETRYQFARYFEINGDYATARKFLQMVLEADPLNVRAHARLGMIHFYTHEPDLALKSYQTALALNPHDYNTRYNLGELYRVSFQNNENALREFVAALEQNPEHTEANFRAGLICIGNGMIKEAIRYFEAALKNDRRNIRRLLQLAAAYERLGDKAQALSVYQEITDIDPLHGIALLKIRFLSMEE